jgi:hypothetical protein
MVHALLTMDNHEYYLPLSEEGEWEEGLTTDEATVIPCKYLAPIYEAYRSKWQETKKMVKDERELLGKAIMGLLKVHLDIEMFLLEAFYARIFQEPPCNLIRILKDMSRPSKLLEAPYACHDRSFEGKGFLPVHFKKAKLALIKGISSSYVTKFNTSKIKQGSSNWEKMHRPTMEAIFKYYCTGHVISPNDNRRAKLRGIILQFFLQIHLNVEEKKANNFVGRILEVDPNTLIQQAYDLCAHIGVRPSEALEKDLSEGRGS